MTKNELKAKVSAELKAQGINASDAQIEEALAKVASKQELTEDTLENVAGGGGLGDLVKYVPDAIDVVKKLLGGGDKKDGGGDKKDGGEGGSSGSSGPNYNNTNDGGKQMINQGEGNKNDNTGTMTW